MPPTKRLNAIDLAAALAAMDAPDDCASRADDEPTLEVPAPHIPVDVPSPLGDAAHAHEETLTLDDLGIDLDGLFPRLPEAAAVMRPFDREERRTRHLVIGIWTLALALVAVFAVVFVGAESSPPYAPSPLPAAH